jgi:SLT domain-containing protein
MAAEDPAPVEREPDHGGDEVRPALMRGRMGIGSGHGYAAGTSSAAPGWAWVGERGPELVRFRGGEQVEKAPAA